MKKGIIICFVFFSVNFLLSCGQKQTSQAQTTSINDTTIVTNKQVDDKSINTNNSVIYVSYNGTATDDGNITGKNTNDEFHLFMKNDKQNIVYVISRLNYGLWSSKKNMPSQLKPMTQIYKVDIASSKKLESSDNTVEYYEIIKLNSMIETDEID
ncbi:MAG: hypothetical protein KUL78_08390 [Flavobacterium sp.]|nr:hypothetical protein [Flavobacterium sp.]